MRTNSIVSTTLALNGLALGALDFSKWAPPGHGDVRGPCPAMNSLANHGFIPHTGSNITVDNLVTVLGEVFNLSPELAGVVSNLGLATSDTPEKGWFMLTDLNKHNAFEHDASLSRVDFYFSGTQNVATFDNATFNRWFSHFDGLTYIPLDVAAAARYGQVQYSRSHTPGFTYESQHQITSYAETIKFMRTMVDPNNGLTRRDFVKILFTEERLPFNEGWRPPVNVTNGFVMAQEVMNEALVTPEKGLYYGEIPPTNDHNTTFDVPQCFNTAPDTNPARRMGRTVRYW